MPKVRLVLFRLLLSVGILYGCLTFLEVPFLALGGGYSFLGDTAFVVNGFVTVPACILGFWFRRAAVVCIVANACLTAAGLAFGHMWQPGAFGTNLLNIAPLGLALCLALLEFLPT